MPHTTLAAPATVRGLSLFLAVDAALTITPARPGTGLVFVRTDLPGAPEIPAHVSRVVPIDRHTLLAADPRAITPADLHPRSARSSTAPLVHTTEHVLAALLGLGITDARIELNAPEPPVGDGSAKPFTDAVTAVGLTHADGDTNPGPLHVTSTIRLDADGDDQTYIQATPPDADQPPGTTRFTYHLDYAGALAAAIPSPIPAQTATIDLPFPGTRGSSPFATDVAPARTFALQHEAEAARAAGLFAHLTPADILVITSTGPAAPNAYRFADEPARHKLLDLIGDLALTARPLTAHITASRTGHAHNHALARQLATLA